MVPLMKKYELQKTDSRNQNVIRALDKYRGVKLQPKVNDHRVSVSSYKLIRNYIGRTSPALIFSDLGIRAKLCPNRRKLMSRINHEKLNRRKLVQKKGADPFKSKTNKLMQSKYKSKCMVCKKTINVNDWINFYFNEKFVKHQGCKLV